MWESVVINTTYTFVVGGLVLFGVASGAVIFGRRHRQDLSGYLEPVLRNCGVTYISAVYPGWFRVGPFPKFEAQSGRPQTTTGGTRGEYNEYRIVTFRDSQGRVYHLWAVVEFEMFNFRRVRWRAEQKNSLPPGVLPILEN